MKYYNHKTLILRTIDHNGPMNEQELSKATDMDEFEVKAWLEHMEKKGEVDYDMHSQRWAIR